MIKPVNQSNPFKLSTLATSLITAVILSSSLTLVACSGSDSSSSNINNDNGNGEVQPTPEQPEKQATGKIVGTIIDDETLLPLIGVEVMIGNNKVTSDAEGKFTIDNLDANTNVDLLVKKTGYIIQTLDATISSDADTMMNIRLSEADGTTTADAATQIITAELDGNAKATFAPNTLVRADGGEIVGDVTVQIEKISPAEDPEQMPGTYEIIGGGYMESFGALNIEAVDAAGNEISLGNGNTAKIQIPVSTRSNQALQTTITLYLFDEDQNGWEENGTATLQTDVYGNNYYEGVIGQIGAWNADIEMEVVNVLGCVEDTDGNIIANAIVKGDGINYSSVTTAYTNAAGQFSLPVRFNSNMYVLAQEGTRSSNAISLNTTAIDYQMDECLVVSTDNNSVTMKLTWGESPWDVDSHLLTPDGNHIYFVDQGSLSMAPYANLDVDDTNSYGPEVVTIRKLMVGRYRYGLYNYSGTFEPNMKDSPVRVVLDGAKVESRAVFPTQSDDNNSFWHGFDLVVDEQCNVVVETVDSWLVNDNDFTQLAEIGEAKYCKAD